jgi:hypothetical protein
MLLARSSFSRILSVAIILDHEVSRSSSGGAGSPTYWALIFIPNDLPLSSIYGMLILMAAGAFESLLLTYSFYLAGSLTYLAF